MSWTAARLSRGCRVPCSLCRSAPGGGGCELISAAAVPTSRTKTMELTTKVEALLAVLILADVGCGRSKVSVLTPPGATTGTGGIGAGGTGGLAVGGAPDGGACPPYQTVCNGACIPTSADPSNCGGCGVKCTGTQACSGGTCAVGCLPGLDTCAGSCVDRAADSQNCGTCGNVCPAGKGCVNGGCEDAVPV